MKRRKFKSYTFLGLLEIKEYYKWILKTTNDWTWETKRMGKIRASTWDQSYSSFRDKEIDRINLEIEKVKAEIIFRKITNTKEII